MQQHPNQPYQGQPPAHQVQQSPNLQHPPPNQQQFAVQNAYSHHPNIQSPYLNTPSHFQPQPPQQQQQQPPSQETQYYTADPSPRSSNSASYYPTKKQEHMAAAATMQRPPYPPMYHTPQSNSPASVTSPQTHDHGRSLFSQQSSGMTQPMYPYPYSPMNQMPTPYGSHSQSSMTPTQMLPGPYNPPQMPHSQVASHASTLNTSPRIKSDPNQAFAQTPQQRSGMMNQQHPTPGPTPGSAGVTPSQNAGPTTGSSAAPGPIPATTPLVVRQDNNGVQWIAFEYSRDRVKMEYTIRCDVESVDTVALPQEFKSENCVYPRACVPRDQYKGNRLNYESDCNQVGWALAELNPCLRGKRGLIQRAVDSWRNSNQDPRLRSRRVRRQAKMNNKNRVSNAGPPQSAGGGAAGLPGPNSMPAPGPRGPATLPSAGSQIHHHHGQHDMSPTAQDPSSATGYPTTQAMRHPGTTAQHLASPNELRHAQTFPGYQPYPTSVSSVGTSMAPPMPGTMHHFGRPHDNATMVSKAHGNNVDETVALFGDLPEGKKRKFILVDDTQKNARVRVKVTLDQVNVQDIPDSYRKQNSVFPRSYYPIQMQSEPDAGRFALDNADADALAPTIGRMTVPHMISDGESQIEVAQLTKAKHDRERKINELGYRMAWGQGRVFSNRPIFLARALDAYRSKQRSALVSAGVDESSIPAHLEVRPGKRRWQEHTRSTSQLETDAKAIDGSP